jgi:hypothetical protein
MNGNQPAEQMTATQAGIQVQQGNVTMNDKRYDISDAMGDALVYCIGLLMEFWPAAEALRVTKDKDEFEWVDVAQLSKIPVMVPADKEFRSKWKTQHPDSPAEMTPKWMQLFDDASEEYIKDWKTNHADEIANGAEIPTTEPATKFIDFEISMSIGEGLPSNKVALYNILLSLAQLMLIDEMTGQPKPVLSLQQFMEKAEELLGITLEEAQAQGMPMGMNPQGGIVPQQANGQMPNMPQGGQGQPVQPVNNNAYIPGANMGGFQLGGQRAY